MKKDLKALNDKDLLELTKKFIKQRILLAKPNGKKSVPNDFKIGSIVGVSKWDGEYRCLKINDIQFVCKS